MAIVDIGQGTVNFKTGDRFTTPLVRVSENRSYVCFIETVPLIELPSFQYLLVIPKVATNRITFESTEVVKYFPKGDPLGFTAQMPRGSWGGNVDLSFLVIPKSRYPAGDEGVPLTVKLSYEAANPPIWSASLRA